MPIFFPYDGCQWNLRPQSDRSGASW